MTDFNEWERIEAIKFRAERDAEERALNGHAEKKSQRQPSFKAELLSRNAALIIPEAIDWLWPGRLALGKHTCIAGEPGVGKSQLSISIIAAVTTTTGSWPCGEGYSPICGNVILLSAEDGANDTIVPRLMAAGADRTRVEIIYAVREFDRDGDHRSFNLQTDIALLKRKIAEIGNVVLIIIDPISSYLGKTDSHKNSEVRGVLEPLSEMAERCRVAVLSITHFNKTGANNTTKAMHRFIGSIAFTGAPRVAFCVIEDAENEGRYLMLHAKNNLAAIPQGLAYRLEQTFVAEGIVASRVAWENEPVTITANQALAAEAAGANKTAQAEAEDLLKDLLADGPVPQKEIKEATEGNGLAWATVRRAKEHLGIKAQRQTTADGFAKGQGQWLWTLKVLNPP
jgi:putative DNA primase/helicase